MYWTVHLTEGPQLVKHAATAIGTNIFTFGGQCNEITDNTTIQPINIHVLDTVKLKWLKLELDVVNNNPENIPFERISHSVVAQGSKVYLWGGCNHIEDGDTLFCFDTETLKWSKPNVYGNIPSGRSGHSACIIQNCMYIYGGYQKNSNQFSRDIFMLNLHTMKWSIIKVQGKQPSRRNFHTATAVGDRMYIYGGEGSHHGVHPILEGYSHNVHYLDTTTKKWVTPVVRGYRPLGRRSHCAFSHNGFLYIFGGYYSTMDLYFNDINRFDLNRNKWMAVVPAGISLPCARRSSICQVINDKVFISGGTSSFFRSYLSVQEREDLGEQNIDRDQDHGDLHILNISPSLADICLVNSCNYMKKNKIHIDDLCIPLSLKKNLANLGYHGAKKKLKNHTNGI